MAEQSDCKWDGSCCLCCALRPSLTSWSALYCTRTTQSYSLFFFLYGIGAIAIFLYRIRLYRTWPVFGALPLTPAFQTTLVPSRYSSFFLQSKRQACEVNWDPLAAAVSVCVCGLSVNGWFVFLCGSAINWQPTCPGSYPAFAWRQLGWTPATPPPLSKPPHPPWVHKKQQ